MNSIDTLIASHEADQARLALSRRRQQEDSEARELMLRDEIAKRCYAMLAQRTARFWRDLAPHTKLKEIYGIRLDDLDRFSDGEIEFVIDAPALRLISFGMRVMYNGVTNQFGATDLVFKNAFYPISQLPEIIIKARQAYVEAEEKRALEAGRQAEAETLHKVQAERYAAAYRQYGTEARKAAAFNRITVAAWNAAHDKTYRVQELRIALVARDDEAGLMVDTEYLDVLGAGEKPNFWRVIDEPGEVVERWYAHVVSISAGELRRPGTDAATAFRYRVYAGNAWYELVAPPDFPAAKMQEEAERIANRLQELPEPPKRNEFSALKDSEILSIQKQIETESTEGE